MISPSEINQKAGRLYPKFVASWLVGESFFPRHLPANLKVSADLSKAKREVDSLRAGSKTERSLGYAVRWEERKSKTHGLNQFPAAITIETQEDLLALTGKGKEFARLRQSVEVLRRRMPALDSWLVQSTHWKDLLGVADKLEDLLLMTQYLLDNPKPNCFAREIPLPVSTKLIEENKAILAEWLDRLRPHEQIDFRFGLDEFAARYGLKYPRHHILLRILDFSFQNELGLKFAELSLPAESLNELQPQRPRPIVFIVENKVNLLSLPPIGNAVAIGGIGKAISLLREVNWLYQANLIYWGDLDVEGFEMLSQCREIFAHTQSFLMDLETVQNYSHLAIEWGNASRSIQKGLTTPEMAAFTHLLQNKLRIEQERIPQLAVVQAVQELELKPVEAISSPDPIRQDA